MSDKRSLRRGNMVSAWGCEQRLVLGQIATDAKSNEITAVPKLLEMLARNVGCAEYISAKALFALRVGFIRWRRLCSVPA